MSNISSFYLQELQSLLWKWGRQNSWVGHEETKAQLLHKFSLFGLTSIIPNHLTQGSETAWRLVMENTKEQFLRGKNSRQDGQLADTRSVVNDGCNGTSLQGWHHSPSHRFHLNYLDESAYSRRLRVFNLLWAAFDSTGLSFQCTPLVRGRVHALQSAAGAAAGATQRPISGRTWFQ